MKMEVNLDRYVRETRQDLQRSQKRVKNSSVFDFNYIPKKVFIRDEAKNILDSIVRFDYLKTPFNLFIYGSRGSGKTVLMKYLMSYLKEKIDTPVA